MTTVTFLTEEARIVGFDAQGHSGYAAEGEDLVCAAVTSAVRLVEATVNDVMGLCAAVKVREQDTAISFRLPGGLAPTAESTCQNLLTGLMVYLAQLHDEYPENIEVAETAGAFLLLHTKEFAKFSLPPRFGRGNPSCF